MLAQRESYAYPGNERRPSKIALKKTFAEGDSLRQDHDIPYGYQYDPQKPKLHTAPQGSIAIYIRRRQPFELQAVIYNKKRGYREAKRIACDRRQHRPRTTAAPRIYQMEDTDVVGERHFCKAFDGYVGVGPPRGHRDRTLLRMVDYSVVTTRNKPHGDDYVLGFEVMANPDTR